MKNEHREPPANMTLAKDCLPSYYFRRFRGNDWESIRHRLPVNFNYPRKNMLMDSECHIRSTDVKGPVEGMGINCEQIDKEVLRTFRREKRKAEAIFRVLDSDWETYRETIEAQKALYMDPLKARSREIMDNMLVARKVLEEAEPEEKALISEQLERLDEELNEISWKRGQIQQIFSLQNPWIVNLVCTRTPTADNITHHFVKSVVKSILVELRELPDRRCTVSGKNRLVIEKIDVQLKFEEYRDFLPMELASMRMAKRGRCNVRECQKKTGTKNFYSTKPIRKQGGLMSRKSSPNSMSLQPVTAGFQ